MLPSDKRKTVADLTIRRISIAGQLAAAIREKILNGELRPGTQLQEIPMASSAGVSRNTMREAFQVLVREGLVRHNVNRGCTVTQLTDKDLDDIYGVRRVLEIAGVRASAKAKPNEFASLDLLVEEIRRSAEAKDYLQTVTNDLLLHRHLVAFLGSQRLNDFFATLLSELRLGLVLVDKLTFETSRLVAQHRELVDLLRRGKTEECVAYLVKHLAESEQNLRDIISSQPNRVSNEAAVPSSA